jgi:large subunit ribosomal protein L21
MYAIVEVGGMQYKVTKAASVLVPRVKQDPGKKIDLDRVLLIVDDGKVMVGTPLVKNAVVKATIVSHIKDDKVLVFKKKRRKNYKVLRGHRQQLTEIQIDSISLKQAEAPAQPKAEKKRAPKAKPVAKAAKPEKASAAKPKTTPKPAAAKTAAVKKDSAPKKTEKKTDSNRASSPKTKKSDSKPSAKKEA